MDRFGFLEQVFPGLSVNKVFVESRNPIVTIGFILAANEFNDKTAMHLKILGYEKSEIADIVFLQSLINFHHERIADVVKKREMSGLKLADVLPVARQLETPAKTLQEIFRFQLSIRGNDPRLKDFRGPAIKAEISRLEAENFLEKIA
jgi:hypothetical protein